MDTYEQAVEAINKMFGDTSVTSADTRERLYNLLSVINVMIDSLETDADFEELEY